MSVAALPEVYQLRIRLCAISPLIWRRLLVRSDTSIADLHHLIQHAFGWSDSHLHRFVIYGKAYGIAYLGGIWFSDDPEQVRLADFCFRPNERFAYEYDFHDLWRHAIRLEQILPLDRHRSIPSVLVVHGPGRRKIVVARWPSSRCVSTSPPSTSLSGFWLLWSSMRMSTTHKLNWRHSGIGLGWIASIVAPSIVSSGSMLRSWRPHPQSAWRC